MFSIVAFKNLVLKTYTYVTSVTRIDRSSRNRDMECFTIQLDKNDTIIICTELNNWKFTPCIGPKFPFSKLVGKPNFYNL